MTVEGSWPGFWYVSLCACTHRPHTPLGPMCSARASLVNWFLSPRSLFFVGWRCFATGRPFCDVPAALSRMPLSCSFPTVLAYLRIFHRGFLKFLQSKATTVLCILPQPGGWLCDPSSTLVQLREPDLQSKGSSAGGLA